MRAKIILLFLFLLFAAFISLKCGTVNISWSDFLKFFVNSQNLILKELRIPRIVAAILIGSSLGVVGLVFQTILRNPLAEPYTLGLSGGSSLGAVLALNLGLLPAVIWIPIFSTLGCFFAVILVLLLAHKQLEFESRSLILFGIMISLFFGALVVTSLSIMSPDKLQSALLWLLGEFGTTRDQWIYNLSPILIFCTVFLYYKHKALDVLSLGEARSLSLGYSPKTERRALISICTLCTAMGVSIAGLIGFVGLVSPHLARRILKTSQHKYLIVASGLIGGILLLGADTVARTVASPLEIPAGSVAALFGAPVLILLLVRKNHAAND